MQPVRGNCLTPFRKISPGRKISQIQIQDWVIINDVYSINKKREN